MFKVFRALSTIGIIFSCSVNVWAVDMEYITISDAMNTADTEIMTTDGSTGYGSVDYIYKIGRHEVSNSQYCEFLNAVASADTYGLYNTNMSSGYGDSGGIVQNGTAGNYSYSVRSGYGNKPVNHVSFYDSLRFANWLHNGQPTGEQTFATTEDGAYDMLLGFDVVRKAGAQVWLTSEDEWYKAAYYKGGGIEAEYWDYATASNICPIHELPPGGNNSANYDTHQVVDVGAYINSPSTYGTFDQNGNMMEWTEDIIYGNKRVIRGGHWYAGADYLISSYRVSYDPLHEYELNGFRVATIPEPFTLSLLALGGLALMRKRRV